MISPISKGYAKIAHKHGIPLIVDNTSAPYIFKPIDFGADIVVYSATKFIGGHGTSLGGVIVDSGKFNWENGKFPLITDPDPSYHGLKFVEALRPFGNIAYIIKARVNLLRDLGPAQSPFNSFLLLQGLETLHLRIARHCENALKVAKFLEKHPKVQWVNYPGLESSPEKDRVKKYLPKGAGGDHRVRHKRRSGRGEEVHRIPAADISPCQYRRREIPRDTSGKTTHSQLSERNRYATGVTPDFIRLSIGIEDIDDILADIEQALKKS